MIKTIRLFVVSALVAFSISFNSFAFNASDLSKYDGGVATKPLSQSDTPNIGKNKKEYEVMGTIILESVFGKESKDYETKFIYIGDKEFESETISTRWLYYYHESWKDRRNPGRGRLKYKNNNVMKVSDAGDLLVVGKKSDNEIDIIIIQQGNKAIKDVYKFLGEEPVKISKSTSTAEKPSFFARMFGNSDEPTAKSSEDTSEYDLEEASFDDLISMADLSKTDVEVFRNDKTGQKVIQGSITKFVDGDTIHIQDIFRVRLSGTDTPEKAQNCVDKKGSDYACGIAATENLRKIVGKSKVICTHIKFEKWGRYLWDCQTTTGKHLGREQIKSGHAVVSTYPPILYDKEEQHARDNKLGMWKGEFQHPHCWRHRKDGKGNKKICGTKEFWKLYPDIKSGKLKP